MNLAERCKLLATYFNSNQANRPKTRKALEAYIQTVFGKTLSGTEVEETVQGLVVSKIFALSGKGDVVY
jgi:hypothetical protein